MIPDYIDIEDLSAQVKADNVAIGELGEQYPGLEDALIDVTRQAEANGFGTLKIAVLDRTPEQPADLRDIAQELADRSGAETVIVRSPGTGAVVSSEYSRKNLEEAQHTMLSNPDYVVSTQTFVQQVQSDTTPWQPINIVLAIFVVAVVVAAAVSAYRRRLK